jgi:beta-galactosidase
MNMKLSDKCSSSKFWGWISVAYTLFLILIFACGSYHKPVQSAGQENSLRDRISINKDWRFYKYDSLADDLIYDVRPEIRGYIDNRPADSRPTEAEDVENRKFSHS